MKIYNVISHPKSIDYGILVSISFLFFIISIWISGRFILFQVFIVGIMLGGLYMIASSGLSLVYGVLRILNLAHGDFVIVGAYITYWLFIIYAIDPMISIIFNIIILGVMGVFIQRYLTGPASKYGPERPLLVSFGLMTVLQAAMTQLWSGDIRSVTIGYAGMHISIGALTIPFARLLVFISALILLAFLQLFLSKTYLGKAIRAVSFDSQASELVGIDVKRVSIFAFMIGASLAGIAGAFYSISYSFSPSIGPSLLLRIFTVIILGGIGSITGTLLAGVIIGILESFGSYFIGGGFGDILIFIALLTILMVKPKGLLGKI